MIIVSKETLRGGEKVNELRAAQNLNNLKIHCIDLIEQDTSSLESNKELKISSSNRRMDLLGTRLREPTPQSKLPESPYIVGLVGSIASGKSTMCDRFAKLGAYTINCDQVAHGLYEPNQPCYAKILTEFGSRPNILTEDGRINRQTLGSIVFADSNELDKLNGIVWPALLEEIKLRIAKVREQKSHAIVILEAAVLLKAGWQHECHEIWSLIVPEKEVILQCFS